MTTNKPDVAAYRYTASLSFGKRNPKWHYQESFPHAENRKVEEIGRLEKLIRLSDYEALQAECEQLAGLLGVLGQYFDAMDVIGREGTAASTLIAEAECDEAEARLRDLLTAHRKGSGL